jgi:hypothetical protein
MTPGSSSRPPEWIAKALALWKQGLSQTQIGAELSVTKNVIAGICHRHNFPPRPKPEGETAKSGPVKGGRSHKKSARPPAASIAPALISAPVAAAEPTPAAAPKIAFKPRAKAACCWPMWGHHERPTQIFCDEDALATGPYCQEHHSIAYRPAERVAALLSVGPLNVSATAWQALNARAARWGAG